MSADKHSSEDVALSLTLAIVTSSPAPTQVSIKHTQIALVQDEPETASEPLSAARLASSTISS